MVLINAKINLATIVSIYLILLTTQTYQADDIATIRRQTSISDSSRDFQHANGAEPGRLLINNNCNGKQKQQQPQQPQFKCESGKTSANNNDNSENVSKIPLTNSRKLRNFIKVDNETYVITANDNSTAGYIHGEILNLDSINSGSRDQTTSNQFAHNYTFYLLSKNPNHVAIALDFEQIDLEVRNGCEFQKIEFSLPDISEPKTTTSTDDAITTTNANHNTSTSIDDNNNNTENNTGNNVTDCDNSESKYVTFPLFMRDLWLIFGITLDKTITNPGSDNDFKLANALVDSIRDSTCQELRLKRSSGNSSDLNSARSSRQFVRQNRRPKGRRAHKKASRQRPQQADLNCDEDSFEYRQLAHKKLTEELNWPHLLEICAPVNRLLIPLRALKIRIKSDEFAKMGTFRIRYQFIEDSNEIDFKSNNKFLCRNRKIIALELKCDGFDDCGDASDEPTLGCNALNGLTRENASKLRDAALDEQRRSGNKKSINQDQQSASKENLSSTFVNQLQRKLRFFDRSLLHCCNSKTAWAPLIAGQTRANGSKIDSANKMRFKRIINGSPVRLGDWPAQVSLQTDFTEPFSHWCGGVLVHPEYVLTAAHCITSDYVPYQIKIVFGQTDMMKINPNTTQVRYVDDLIVYPGLSWLKLRQLEKWKNDDKNDFAILKLAAPVVLGPNVLPACLPPVNKAPEMGANCVITGWGRTLGSGNQNLLKKIPQKVVEPRECISELSGLTRFNENTMLCIRNQPPSQRSGICEGDSGGPLFCERNNTKINPDNNNNYDNDNAICNEVAGLVSSSIELEALASLCAVGSPLNVYADTARKVSWIESIMEMLETLHARGERS